LFRNSDNTIALWDCGLGKNRRTFSDTAHIRGMAEPGADLGRSQRGPHHQVIAVTTGAVVARSPAHERYDLQ